MNGKRRKGVGIKLAEKARKKGARSLRVGSREKMKRMKRNKKVENKIAINRGRKNIMEKLRKLRRKENQYVCLFK